MHILLHLLIWGSLIASILFGVPAYLAPDDLKFCDAQPTSDMNCQRADAIVAISGGDTDSRVDEAVSLYKNGWASTIVFSGAALDQSGPSNALAMQRYAIDEGIPAADILVDEAATTTEENAIGTGQIVREKEFRRIILVTSPYHQRRAYMEFTRKIDKGVTVLNHPTTTDREWQGAALAQPREWSLALTELIKILYISIEGTK